MTSLAGFRLIRGGFRVKFQMQSQLNGALLPFLVLPYNQHIHFTALSFCACQRLCKHSAGNPPSVNHNNVTTNCIAYTHTCT